MTDGMSYRLSELEKLTSAKEQAARAKLAKIIKMKRDKEKLVAELRVKTYQPASSIEASLISRWQVWQKAELAKLNTELAAIEAIYRNARLECGRQIAENAVLSELVKNAKREELAQNCRRQMLTSLDEQYP